jgi:hypothetical protein
MNPKHLLCVSKVSSLLDDVTGGGLLNGSAYLDRKPSLEAEAKLRDAMEHLTGVKTRFESKSALVATNTPVINPKVAPGTPVLEDPSGEQEESRTPASPRGEDEGLRSETGISEVEPEDIASKGETSGVEPPPGDGDTSSICRDHDPETEGNLVGERHIGHVVYGGEGMVDSDGEYDSVKGVGMD